MNTKFEVRRSKADSRAEFKTFQVRRLRTFRFMVVAGGLIALGCGSAHTIESSNPQDTYRLLAVSDVQSFLYREPGTQRNVPQVRGSLRNLGNKTLVIVEFKLSFKNHLNRVIFEETADPIYVSSLSVAQSGKALVPGQPVRFAFKSPTCPEDWEPGQVEVRVNRVVAGNS